MRRNSLWTSHRLSTHLWHAHSSTDVPPLVHAWRIENKCCETISLTQDIYFGMLPNQERQWLIQQCTVFLPAIMLPLVPSIPTGLTQSQSPLSPPFAQPQGGLHEKSYHMYASEIQHLIAHATATQKKTFHMGRENRVNIDRSSNYQWQKKIECEPCVDWVTTAAQ